MNMNTLSQVTRWLEWSWDLERLWSFDLCLVFNALALVLNENFRRLGCLELWWLGDIYSPQPPTSCWGRLLAMGAPDSLVHHRTGPVHCPVRYHVTQPLGFGARSTIGALSSCGTGLSGATPDRFCSLSGAPLTLWLWLCAHCSSVSPLLQSTIARVSRCSAGAPDSPRHTG
jgi:hypothetical protein